MIIKKVYIKLLLMFFFNLIFFSSDLYSYYRLNWDDINFQMGRQANWYRIYLETKTDIYDPFKKNKNTNKRKVKPDIKKGYKQKIYWKRDKTLIFETLDINNNLLHIYYSNNSVIKEQNISKSRNFTLIDLKPLYISFLTNNKKIRNQFLEEWNLLDKEVSQYWNDGKLFYCIGNKKSGYYILLNSKTFELIYLQKPIYVGENKNSIISIKFKNFKKFIGQRIPQITEFYIDNKLFKKETILKVKEIKKIPYQKLIEKFKTYTSGNYISLQKNYVN